MQRIILIFFVLLTAAVFCHMSAQDKKLKIRKSLIQEQLKGFSESQERSIEKMRAEEIILEKIRTTSGITHNSSQQLSVKESGINLPSELINESQVNSFIGTPADESGNNAGPLNAFLPLQWQKTEVNAYHEDSINDAPKHGKASMIIVICYAITLASSGAGLLIFGNLMSSSVVKPQVEIQCVNNKAFNLLMQNTISIKSVY